MLDQSQILDIMREAVSVALRLAVPLLAVSLGVGLFIAIFQAATQIHEQTLTFVPKLLVITMLLLLGGSYMMNTLIEFIQQLFDIMSSM